MKILKKLASTSLVVRILAGLVIGAILGLVVPGEEWISIFGELFVSALKAVAPVLVFVLVSASLASAKGGHAEKFRSVIFFYLLSTMTAAVAAVFINFIFQVKVPLEAANASTENLAPPGSVRAILSSLFKSIVSNPIESLSQGNYIALLFWAVILGIALKNAKDSTKSFLNDMADSLSLVVSWIIKCAPIGIMGLVFNAVSTSGLAIFKDYGTLVLLLVCSMLFTAFVINAIIVGIALRRNPYPLILYCMKRSALTAFFTRSSAANIPVNMELCKDLGLNEEMYSVSIPLGSTINMDGAAVVITTLTLVAAHTTGVKVSLPMAILLSIVATLSACGTSGVAGGSLLLVPLGCSMFGIPSDIAMQMVGIGFIISVIQDSMETALNSSGDAIFTATAEFRSWLKEGKELPL